MSRPFRMNEKQREVVLEDLRKQLPKLTSAEDGFTVKYKVENVKEKEPVNIEFTPSAYIKTVQLICANKEEVGWDGTVTKVGPKHYLVDDIFVYPQQVTGAKVDTDDAEYTKYLAGFDEETFFKIRLNSHSHVRMDPQPSGTDLAEREKFVYQIKEDGFYIFMIWNKYMNYTCEVYDAVDNKVYGTDDCVVTVTGMPDDTFTIIEESKEMVKQKTYTSYGGNYGSYAAPNYTYPAAKTTRKDPVSYLPKAKNKLLEENDIDLEDLIDYYGGEENIPFYLR